MPSELSFPISSQLGNPQVVNPYSAGTLTLQEAPSFAWRTNDTGIQRRAQPVRCKFRVGRRSGDIAFRSPRFPFLGRRMEDCGLSDRQSTDASDRPVDSRVVLVRTNDRL